jgi:hypothetical protein
MQVSSSLCHLYWVLIPRSCFVSVNHTGKSSSSRQSWAYTAPLLTSGKRSAERSTPPQKQIFLILIRSLRITEPSCLHALRFIAVLADSRHAAAVGAPFSPGLRIFSPDPAAIRLRLALTFE